MTATGRDAAPSGLSGRMSLGLAGVVILLAAASSNDPAAGTAARDLDLLAVAILALALVITWWSPRLPGTVAVVVLVLSFTWYGVGYTSGLINVATLIAFYRLGKSEDQRRKAAIGALSVCAVVINIALVADESWSQALTAAGYLVMALLFGELVRHRQLLLEQYARRAEQAEIDVQHRVAEERLRIARDLHDVLAHTVSAMVVQAGVASEKLDEDREAARAALTSIRATGREAMGEVNATVSVLRSGAVEERAGLAPSPRIDQVAELVDATRRRGLPTELRTSLSGRPLPELVELTAYRIVQESLTNALRHAGASSVRVTIAEEAAALTVDVRDDGEGPEAPVPGFGLRGMAERVESIGGDLRHGRADDGGWVVNASLPVRRSTA